jgi:hypothetical protein
MWWYEPINNEKWLVNKKKKEINEKKVYLAQDAPRLEPSTVPRLSQSVIYG